MEVQPALPAVSHDVYSLNLSEIDLFGHRHYLDIHSIRHTCLIAC